MIKLSEYDPLNDEVIKKRLSTGWTTKVHITIPQFGTVNGYINVLPSWIKNYAKNKEQTWSVLINNHAIKDYTGPTVLKYTDSVSGKGYFRLEIIPAALVFVGHKASSGLITFRRPKATN